MKTLIKNSLTFIGSLEEIKGQVFAHLNLGFKVAGNGIEKIGAEYRAEVIYENVIKSSLNDTEALDIEVVETARFQYSESINHIVWAGPIKDAICFCLSVRLIGNEGGCYVVEGTPQQIAGYKGRLKAEYPYTVWEC